MQRKAVYPGTFDPITNGHVDIIGRAAALFDEVVVAVASSRRKAPFLPLETRLILIAQVTEQWPNVRVESIGGLLVDFAKQQGTNIIVRGLRAVTDFDYEFQQAGMNRQMAKTIETVFLPATEAHGHISGTMVREIFTLGGDVSLFVPDAVVKVLASI
jgi:pantetheine-phosphate adenylyltransferase